MMELDGTKEDAICRVAEYFDRLIDSILLTPRNFVAHGSTSYRRWTSRSPGTNHSVKQRILRSDPGLMVLADRPTPKFDDRDWESRG